jgi:hypothetical protein
MRFVQNRLYAAEAEAVAVATPNLAVRAQAGVVLVVVVSGWGVVSAVEYRWDLEEE